mmetsp:Transcript_33909/g.74422  ORF Transcript_33909/g.74422 Transcript_33909/m.74422 type:complete len:133 (-) Transcript_33909:328-726(-)
MNTALILTGQCARIVETWLAEKAETASERPFSNSLDTATPTEIAQTPFAPRSVRLGLGARFVPHATGPELSGAELQLKRKLQRAAFRQNAAAGKSSANALPQKPKRPAHHDDGDSEEDSRTSRFSHRKRLSK